MRFTFRARGKRPATSSPALLCERETQAKEAISMRFWLFMALIFLATSLPAESQDKKKKGDLRKEVALKEGSAAPDFTLKDADGKNAVKLSELKGKPVILIFGSCT
jgi:cytochrome oxidase Cu insertion factor (SCO1/SenC/PrrC family)